MVVRGYHQRGEAPRVHEKVLDRMWLPHTDCIPAVTNKKFVNLSGKQLMLTKLLCVFSYNRVDFLTDCSTFLQQKKSSTFKLTAHGVHCSFKMWHAKCLYYIFLTGSYSLLSETREWVSNRSALFYEEHHKEDRGDFARPCSVTHGEAPALSALATWDCEPRTPCSVLETTWPEVDP